MHWTIAPKTPWGRYFCDVGVHATSTSILNSVTNRYQTEYHGPMAFPPSGPLLLFLYVEPFTAAL